MASSSAAYLLPGPSPLIGSKSTLIKQALPPTMPSSSTTTIPTAIHSVHHIAQHQLHHPTHRSSASSHSHQPYSRITPNGDTFHSLTVTTNTSNNSALLTANNNNNNNNGSNNNNNNNTSSMLTSNNNDDSSGGGGGGSSGHSLSQSMESINNIGLTDDEVSKTKKKNVRFQLSIYD